MLTTNVSTADRVLTTTVKICIAGTADGVLTTTVSTVDGVLTTNVSTADRVLTTIVKTCIAGTADGLSVCGARLLGRGRWDAHHLPRTHTHHQDLIQGNRKTKLNLNPSIGIDHSKMLWLA